MSVEVSFSFNHIRVLICLYLSDQYYLILLCTHETPTQYEQTKIIFYLFKKRCVDSILFTLK